MSTTTTVYEGVPGTSGVQLVLEQKLMIPEAVRRLTISSKTLERWMCRARQGQLATLGESRRPMTKLAAEVSRLKHDLEEAHLVRGTLMKAIDTKRPAPGLIYHSDREAQYCVSAYQATLRQFSMIPSISRSEGELL